MAPYPRVPYYEPDGNCDLCSGPFFCYDPKGIPVEVRPGSCDFWVPVSVSFLAGYSEVSEHDQYHLLEVSESEGETYWPAGLLAWEE